MMARVVRVTYKTTMIIFLILAPGQAGSFATVQITLPTPVVTSGHFLHNSNKTADGQGDYSNIQHDNGDLSQVGNSSSAQRQQP